MLIGLCIRWELEGDAAVVVLFFRGGEVELGESDSAGMTGSEVIESLADDGVVGHLRHMAVFKHESCEGRGRFRADGLWIG